MLHAVLVFVIAACSGSPTTMPAPPNAPVAPPSPPPNVVDPVCEAIAHPAPKSEAEPVDEPVDDDPNPPASKKKVKPPPPAVLACVVGGPSMARDEEAILKRDRTAPAVSRATWDHKRAPERLDLIA